MRRVSGCWWWLYTFGNEGFKRLCMNPKCFKSYKVPVFMHSVFHRMDSKKLSGKQEPNSPNTQVLIIRHEFSCRQDGGTGMRELAPPLTAWAAWESWPWWCGCGRGGLVPCLYWYWGELVLPLTHKGSDGELPLVVWVKVIWPPNGVNVAEPLLPLASYHS